MLLIALKQTMTIVILLLVCYTRICTDCFFLAISPLFDILYKLRLDNFLLNKDDDDEGVTLTGSNATGPPRAAPW